MNGIWQHLEGNRIHVLAFLDLLCSTVQGELCNKHIRAAVQQKPCRLTLLLISDVSCKKEILNFQKKNKQIKQTRTSSLAMTQSRICLKKINWHYLLTSISFADSCIFGKMHWKEKQRGIKVHTVLIGRPCKLSHYLVSALVRKHSCRAWCMKVHTDWQSPCWHWQREEEDGCKAIITEALLCRQHRPRAAGQSPPVFSIWDRKAQKSSVGMA